MDRESTDTPKKQCSAWGQAKHHPDAPAGDNAHWAEVKSLLAIERVSDAGTDHEHAEQALPIDVGIERSDGSADTYVAIVVDDARERSFSIIPSSARQLARALVRAADLAD